MHSLKYCMLYVIAASILFMQMHGEDSTSYSRNSALLHTQYLKKDPAQAVIKSLMELTVWQRREDIETSPKDVSSTLLQFPFLGDKEFVS